MDARGPSDLADITADDAVAVVVIADQIVAAVGAALRVKVLPHLGRESVLYRSVGTVATMTPRVSVSDEDLLHRLTELFRAVGFDAASLTRIAEISGLQKSSLYHRGHVRGPSARSRKSATTRRLRGGPDPTRGPRRSGRVGDGAPGPADRVG